MLGGGDDAPSIWLSSKTREKETRKREEEEEEERTE
jgi:hypothetical protein